MLKVSIVGAGNVGSTCAFALFTKNLADIVLVDEIDGLAQGKAIDISQSQAIWRVQAQVEGTTDFSKMKDSQVIVISAGSPRKPGMSRKKLITTNAAIMKSVVDEIKKHSPEAVLIVVANPVDSLTYFAVKYGGFLPKKVIGMSGLVDASRLKYFTSQTASADANKIDASVYGPHSDAMIPQLKNINENDARQVLDEEVIKNIYHRTVNAGAEIVSLLKNGSAFYTPGSAAALIAEAVIADTNLKTEASTMLCGEYGINNVCLGVPLIIGAGGIKQIVEEELSKEQVSKLQQAVEQVRQDNMELAL